MCNSIDKWQECKPYYNAIFTDKLIKDIIIKKFCDGATLEALAKEYGESEFTIERVLCERVRSKK